MVDVPPVCQALPSASTHGAAQPYPGDHSHKQLSKAWKTTCPKLSPTDSSIILNSHCIFPSLFKKVFLGLKLLNRGIWVHRMGFSKHKFTEVFHLQI